MEIHCGELENTLKDALIIEYHCWCESLVRYIIVLKDYSLFQDHQDIVPGVPVDLRQHQE